jgi:hypothetical protein
MVWLGSAVVQGRWLVLSQSDVVEMMELIENVLETLFVTLRKHVRRELRINIIF